MPSRANDSFLPARGVLNLIHRFVVKCQCPLGLMTHFYDEVYSLICFFEDNECQCPLGLMTHFYRDRGARAKRRKEFVSMPSRANDSFLRLWSSLQRRQRSVSMPSRANDSFLLGYVIYYNSTPLMCQCPLGLMTHFYHWQLFLSVSLRRCVSMPSRANDSFLRNWWSHDIINDRTRVNALSG